MKKSKLLLYAFMMLSHVLFAFDTDWDYGLDNGPEPPPATPIDNNYFLILAVAMICCYLVFKARKNRKQC
jgi:hypothetical protein